MTCPRCRQENPQPSKFCLACGLTRATCARSEAMHTPPSNVRHAPARGPGPPPPRSQAVARLAGRNRGRTSPRRAVASRRPTNGEPARSRTPGRISPGAGFRAGTGRTSRPPLVCAKAPHLCLRLLQPERHAHLAVHRRGGREVLAFLVWLADPTVDLCEPCVAVGAELGPGPLHTRKHNVSYAPKEQE